MVGLHKIIFSIQEEDDDIPVSFGPEKWSDLVKKDILPGSRCGRIISTVKIKTPSYSETHARI